MLNLLFTAFGKWLSQCRDYAVTDGYRAFTTRYDRVVPADKLNAVLGRPRSRQSRELDRAWAAFQNEWITWRTQAATAALAASERIRAVADDHALEDTLVAILVDQSGSMRGQNMLLAAMAADVAGSFLINLGARVEVLGFTTTTWRGGRSRRAWAWSGRPSQPGRLCDLLHIVYRTVDDQRPGTTSSDLKQMLRPDLPKENVDGEALEWAARRLREKSQKRKLLIAISDGAPVDDSTLMENGPDYLMDHLRSVVRDIDHSGDILLAQVAIGATTGECFTRSLLVHTPTDLGSKLIEMIERMLLEAPLGDVQSATA